ncbi:hypothetical protein L3Q82_017642 [Scortum barcoo]|uniref:Uncharacterized protein n=1 Tax=Scortum barcoo TaxID=214431 RepID=A0ACB8VMD8_9TELE|nr:hypothetical protein L3Q82_017642 [Scortum barcoo]
MFSASIVDAGRFEVVDARYRQATKQAKLQPGRSWRQKLGSGRSSVRPWRRTIGRPRRDSGKPSGASEGGRGEQYSANTVYSAGGELLTSTGDIVGRWKKYFEDLLNPTDLPSNEEAEAGVSEVDSSITQAEVTEVVRKLLAVARRRGWMRSALSTSNLWMLWGCLGWTLTRLCNIAWRLGDSASGVANLGWWSLFLKRGPESVFQLQGDHTSQPPGKVYARVLERRIRPIVDPRIQEEQCGFRPGRGTLDQLYTLHRVLEGLWEFAQPVHMCFVDLEKAFDRVPRGILWGCSMRVWGPGSLC